MAHCLLCRQSGWPVSFRPQADSSNLHQNFIADTRHDNPPADLHTIDTHTGDYCHGVDIDLPSKPGVIHARSPAQAG
jgi:hypothetical protein